MEDKKNTNKRNVRTQAILCSVSCLILLIIISIATYHSFNIPKETQLIEYSGIPHSIWKRDSGNYSSPMIGFNIKNKKFEFEGFDRNIYQVLNNKKHIKVKAYPNNNIHDVYAISDSTKEIYSYYQSKIKFARYGYLGCGILILSLIGFIYFSLKFFRNKYYSASI